MPASRRSATGRSGALFELHIEQGPILEAEGQRIGVVTGGQGTRWYDCEVIGAEAHAGPTPMEARRDALRAAAELLGEIYQIAHDQAPDGRATVGELRAYPGSRNTVPGRVAFTVDLRHPDGGVMDAMDHALREAFERARGRARRAWSSICTRSGMRRRWRSIRPASMRCARRRPGSACPRARS